LLEGPVEERDFLPSTGNSEYGLGHVEEHDFVTSTALIHGLINAQKPFCMDFSTENRELWEINDNQAPAYGLIESFLGSLA
jgi:hypothetical protein